MSLPMKQAWLGMLAKAASDPSNTKFVSVEFVKKDGSMRKVTFNPAGVIKNLVGDNASDVMKRAVETRKINHPDLVNVVDIHKSREIGKPAFVSFSIKNVTNLKYGGKEYHAT